MSVISQLFSIGHSNTDFDVFYKKLQNAEIESVIDVRSIPYSKYTPHFNREDIERSFKAHNMMYQFLGDKIGGKPSDNDSYTDHIADYEKMALKPSFLAGLERVIEEGKKHKTVLMCSEKNPGTCHRCLLVGRALKEKGITIYHILDDGTKLSQSDLEDALYKSITKKEKALIEAAEDKLGALYKIKNIRHGHKDAGYKKTKR